MKTLLTTLILIITGTLMAQEVTISSHMERTVAGSKMGMAVGYKFPYGVTVGGFYQEAPKFFDSPERKGYNYEKVFTGAYLAYPLGKNFDFNIRTGVSNGRNFLITPSVWGYLKLIKNLDWGLGVGARSFIPTLQTSLRFKLS